MALDVTISTNDIDASLVDSITLKNVKYSIKFDRGVKIFRLRMLKAFEAVFKTTMGDYIIPPVVAVDGGSTLWTYSLECYLKGNPAAANGPVDDVEAQMMVIKNFIELKSYLASVTTLQIGNQIKESGHEMVLRGGGVEGKLMNGQFDWISEKHGIIKFTVQFVGCVDLSFF